MSSRSQVARAWAQVRARAVVAAIAAVLLSTVISMAQAAPPFPTHKCGSFTHRVGGSYPVTYHLTVLNGGVPCRTATAVIRAFWSGHGVTQHGGPSDAQSYWTLAHWPGWRCHQGAGAGTCSKGREIAAYEVK